MYKRLFEVDPWTLKTTSLPKEDKRLMESLTSLGNGYMGSRGMFEEQYSGDTHQGVYIAGVWFPDKTRVGWWKNGYPDYFGKVINATNFIAVDLFVNGVAVDLATIAPEDFLVELNMHNGLLTRKFVVTIDKVQVEFTLERFLSIVESRLSLQKISARILKGSGEISFISRLQGNVQNEDANYDENFWEERQVALMENYGVLTAETKANPFGVSRFTVSYVMDNQVTPQTEKIFTSGPLVCQEEMIWQGAQGDVFTLEKTVAVTTSRDEEMDQLVVKASDLLKNAANKNFSQHLQEQTAAWEKRWEQSDVKIFGSDEAQQGIRFNLFQLFSTYYGEDERLNIGPKGFTGEKYGGATYWDTEACIVPMYLSVAPKKVTEKLLQYRLNQLPGAFVNAKRQGLKGALYPMVTFTGVECHNEWEITFEELHRNGAIVEAIYNYTTYTGDENYLLNDGIKVVVEVARFWADRVHFSKRRGLYMIHGVTGPNEYENNINNNWYTNYLARWVLTYALENLPKASVDAQKFLQVSSEEIFHWQDIVKKMYLPEDDELGIFVQHDTFLDKDLMPAENLDPKERPLNQHWSWDKILRSCFIKQADVLQGIYFFNDAFTLEEKKRNFDFYEPMTVHESSLSASVHAILAAELGYEEKAVEMYQRTSRLDLDNYNNDTEDGLHITSMSGGWLSIVQGFAGMKTTNGLSFKPFCPKDWQGYSFTIGYQERLIEVVVDHDSVTLNLKEGQAIELELYGQTVALKDTVSAVY
ncbi:glycoside hydrolase family 65 protein [Enterococcus timonensis]|uniref:glycoside hydrolase family 65 protein n=1 Tax=Enterococcus timonensis TaxID=1852364 RepID=UPI0008D95308|nr:glycoside hydrolase family 65 protein [Enterococcus timonensis]